MNVDLNRIATALQEAEAGPIASLTPVTPYVWQHIYLPLTEGKDILFADLDFEEFDSDDLDALENRLNDHYDISSRLSSFNRVFCNADPVSTTTRIFC